MYHAYIGNDLLSSASDDKKKTSVEDILKELNMLKEESFVDTYVESIQIKIQRSSGLISMKEKRLFTNTFGAFFSKLIDEIAEYLQRKAKANGNDTRCH